MKDIKTIIAKNISELRQSRGMTQLELADRLNYSDKAISKWERGESCPDVSVLLEIADIFGVSLDFIAREERTPQEIKASKKLRERYSRGTITCISILLVWFVALLAYVVISLVSDAVSAHWLAFIYAVPVSFIVWLVLNSCWFDNKFNYFIISGLMWSGLLSIFLSFLPFGAMKGNLWLIFLLGIPSQLIILLWSKIKKKAPKNK